MTFQPPDFTDWLVFYAHCEEDHRVQQHTERDAKTGDVYYEWTCRKCDTPLLTMTRAKPSERKA